MNGEDLWYLLPPTLNEWVSAGYVQSIGPAPRWCGSSERFVGRTTTALSRREAPTAASALVGPCGGVTDTARWTESRWGLRGS
jgi:hypothetical protein